MSKLFVTGTDTGIGKTVVAAAIGAALGAGGWRVAFYKPVETGRPEDADRFAGSDCERLARAARPIQHPADIATYVFAEPAAPLVAAEKEGASVDPARLVAAVDDATAKTETLIIEGAGGLLVPIAPAYTYLDLARDTGAEALVVVGSRLGCINHALLTLDALARGGVTTTGFVVNCLEPGEDAVAFAESNRETIQQFTDAKFLGMFPYTADAESAEPDVLARLAESTIDMNAIG